VVLQFEVDETFTYKRMSPKKALLHRSVGIEHLDLPCGRAAVTLNDLQLDRIAPIGRGTLDDVIHVEEHFAFDTSHFDEAELLARSEQLDHTALHWLVGEVRLLPSIDATGTAAFAAGGAATTDRKNPVGDNTKFLELAEIIPANSLLEATSDFDEVTALNAVLDVAAKFAEAMHFYAV
jgi:hypothetical protein